MLRPSRSTLALLATALLAGGLQAAPQSTQPLALGDPPFALPVDRPSPAVSGAADHAVVAINARGDVCVAWHTQRVDLTGEPAQVEAAVLRYLGGGLWEAPLDATSGLLFVLGDPAVHVLQSQVHEACRKPDVVSVGNDFVVAWPRTPLGGNTAGVADTRLEAARLFLDPASGSWQVDEQSPGVGWELDGAVSNGAGGVMPDLAAHDSVWPGQVAALYAHAVRETLPERDFELRLAFTDFRVSPPAVRGIWTLDGPIPLDDGAGTGGPSGGKILADAVFLDGGDLVVAYEAYAVAGHSLPGIGPVPFDQGRVLLERWDLGSGSPVLAGPRSLLFGNDRANWQRRPNLAASRADRRDSVSITWMEQANVPLSDVDVHHREFSWPTPGGPAAATDLLFPNSPLVSHRMPVPVHGDGQLRLCLSSEGTSTPRAGVVWDPVRYPGLGLIPLPPAPMDKWRFAAALGETGSAQALAATWESPTGPGGAARIQVILRQP